VEDREHGRHGCTTSARPASRFSYVANGDLNGDGYNGNDLLYIPHDATNPSEMRIGTGVDGAFVQNVAAAQAFNRFIDAQPVPGRAARSHHEARQLPQPRAGPARHLRPAVDPAVPGHQLALQLDIFNFLNFLNKNWGQIQLADAQPDVPGSAALSQTGRNAGPLSSRSRRSRLTTGCTTRRPEPPSRSTAGSAVCTRSN